MFLFGYDYVNMKKFVTSQVTNVILEPFCKVEPYLRRKFLEKQKSVLSHCFAISCEKQNLPLEF